MLAAISIAMFVALAGWGQDYFGWSDPTGEIQLSIIVTFVLGIICGTRVNR